MRASRLHRLYGVWPLNKHSDIFVQYLATMAIWSVELLGFIFPSIPSLVDTNAK